MLLTDLNKYDWNKIQETYNNGETLNNICNFFKISQKNLKRAVNENKFKKIKRKQIFSDESKKIMSDKRKTYLKNNPDKHPWKNKNKYYSLPCEKIKKELIDNNITFIEEYQPLDDRFFSIDIAFPDKKIGLEINGNQHYNKDGTLKKYYQERHNLIEQKDWVIYEIHYSLAHSKEFLKTIIKELKNNYNLSNIDYSFYIKEKIQPKYGNKEKYWDNVRLKNKLKEEKKIELILNSDIDFNKFGWVGKVANIINKQPQKVNQWMKKYMIDFYNEKCFKSKR